MQEFIEIPATESSLKKRKPVYGIGINDANYIVQPTVNGKRLMCPIYQVWKEMLKRCCCPKYQKRFPTYIGCSVVVEWLAFSVFRAWMEKQDWEGKQLDKDILIIGNKEYGPRSCIFVSGQINTLLVDHSAKRGDYPQGVDFHKLAGKYRSSCRVSGKKKHLGLFASILEAESTYLAFKSDLIKKIAFGKESVSNPKLQEALLIHSDIFKRKADEIAAQFAL